MQKKRLILAVFLAMFLLSASMVSAFSLVDFFKNIFGGGEITGKVTWEWKPNITLDIEQVISSPYGIYTIEGSPIRENDYFMIPAQNLSQIMRLTAIRFTSSNKYVRFQDVITGTTETYDLFSDGSGQFPSWEGKTSYLKLINIGASNESLVVTWGNGSSSGNVGIEASNMEPINSQGYRLHIAEGKPIRENDYFIVNPITPNVSEQLFRLDSIRYTSSKQEITVKDVETGNYQTISLVYSDQGSLTLNDGSTAYLKLFNGGASNASIMVTWGTGSSPGNVGSEKTFFVVKETEEEIIC